MMKQQVTIWTDKSRGLLLNLYLELLIEKGFHIDLVIPLKIENKLLVTAIIVVSNKEKDND